MTKSKNHPLPDQEQRDLITRELDRSLLVEAAAGTGKTTSMIQRMVALLAEGKCRIEALAAVTFTRKAAAELRSRFQVDLEKTAQDDIPESSRIRLHEALNHIERCFIGTIHSFCARILRERPVEAGVGVSFQEIDEKTDQHLREQAWDEYVAELVAHENPILDELNGLGIEIGQLKDTFIRLSGYPDVQEWPARKVPLPDLGTAIDTLREYALHMEALSRSFPENTGNDRLMPLYRLVPRWLRQADLSIPGNLMEILGRFPGAKPVLKCWPEGAEQGRQERARWAEFTENVVDPLLVKWREHRYEPLLRAVHPAIATYDRLRKEAGMLNYQDLLLKAAELLREGGPAIRDYFRDRFTHLLVDEFQDTDPIQGEVMLLMTADDPDETNWRKCRPIAGSLFVVGDPKQSIYRFRRADIVTYNQVKEIIKRSDGRVISLSANFRTIEPVVDWVNHAFDAVFPDKADEYSPAYVPLHPTRPKGSPNSLTGVQALRVPDNLTTKETVIGHESDLLARTIRSLIDSGRTVPRSPKEIEYGSPETVHPGDFLVVTRNKGRLSHYARRLQELRIPHRVTGGSAMNEVGEIGFLYTCLRAVTRPDDPVALVAVLRSELFGLSDPALYAFKRAGGRFSFHTTIPEGLASEDADVLKGAFSSLETYSLWLKKMPPVAAMEKIAADLGLFLSACAHPGGNFRAGSLAKALELLRNAQADLWTAGDLVEALGRLAKQEEPYDGLPARMHDDPYVRVMNLHQAKGLEAPIVFLADPSGESDHPVGLHIDRSSEKTRGYLVVFGEAVGYASPPVLARPEEWDLLAKREKLFEKAEKTRLLYVAATRAGSQLTITQRGKGNKSNPWGFFNRFLSACPQLSDPGPQQPPFIKKTPVKKRETIEAFSSLDRRWAEAMQHTYSVAPMKAVSVTSGRRGVTAGEHGTEWGTVIHILLENAMGNPEADLHALAASALADQNLDIDFTDLAVRTVMSVSRSAIWKRARASERCLVELPLQTLLSPKTDPDISSPTVLRGVIDLVFSESKGWVIVDYKTDDRPEMDIDQLVKHYRPQVITYAEAWEKATGGSVVEKGLYFVRTDKYIIC